MANVKYSDLLPEVLPNLAADPSDPVTEHAIKRAAIQFCRDSWIWKHLPDALDLVAGESTYDLEPEPGADVSVVINVTANGVPLSNKSADWLDTDIPGWRSTRATPKYFTQVDTEQVILAPVPDINVTGGIVMTLALQPDQRAIGFPKWIYNQYVYQIAQGAVAYLMLMPNKPWTNLQEGSAFMAKFMADIASARNDAVTALGRAPNRTRPQH